MKISGYIRTVLILICFIAGFLVVCLFPDLCDLYTDHIYVKICNRVSKITGNIRINLGECIMYLLSLSLVLLLIFLILLIFLRKKKGYKKFTIGYVKTISILLLLMIVVYMFTWAVPFSGKVLGGKVYSKRVTYTNDEVETVLKYLVKNINQAADEIDIKYVMKGNKYTVEFKSDEEMNVLVIEALRSMEEDYPRLSGYYPVIKIAYCSDGLDIMNIGGYNYPYTMEPTCNKYVDPLYQPLLNCHEYVHHKGYYKENEANFISEIALSKSKDPYLRLIAYLDMYYYVSSAYYEKNHKMPDDLPKFTERVKIIQKASYEIRDKKYNEDSHFFSSNENISNIIKKTGDKGWEIQGDILKENSYDGVTLLLFQFFDTCQLF